MLKDTLRVDVVVYGPYFRKDGRKHVILYDGQNRKTMSYPKWLMENHLGRELKDFETIDHINRNFTDDSIDNLRILNRKDHGSIDALRVKLVRCKCVWCGKTLFRIPSEMRYKNKRGISGPFCSRRCFGSYGAELQNGRINRFSPQQLVSSEKYRLDKSHKHGPVAQ